MISFIVIGKNEGWKITSCIKSIEDCIKQNQISDFEIIYVDSSSTDDSISRVKEFPAVKIFIINGEINAAVARNCGFEVSKGHVLFFIDGDMEITKDFLPIVFESDKLKFDFVTGQFINNYYNSEWKYEFSENYHIDLVKDSVDSVTGGIFLIKREIYQKVNGMNNIFKISQDIDLGLRLRKIGYPILRKKEVIAKHHTINYLDKNRMWKDLLRGNEFYERSLIFRHHLLNRFFYRRFIRNDYSLLLLVFSSILSALFKNAWILIPYAILIIIKSGFKSKLSPKRFLEFTAYYVIRDILTFLGILFFWPKKYRNFNLLEVRST